VQWLEQYNEAFFRALEAEGTSEDETKGGENKESSYRFYDAHFRFSY